MSWSVVHADLRRGIHGARHPKGPAFIVFWWGPLPLGAEAFTAEELPLGHDQVRTLAGRFVADQLAARVPRLGGIPDAGRDGRPKTGASLHGLRDFAAATESLDELATPASAPADDLSVIVCTRDRPQMLRRCLASLDAQRAPPGEIIVVDNAPRAGARPVCAEFPQVRHVHEPRPGLGVARNAGVAAASCSLVAFTDDDVEAHPGWTGELVRSFSEAPDVEAVTGLVLPASLATHAQRFYELRMGGFGTGFVPIRFGTQFVSTGLRDGLQVWRIGAGANMAFRRRVFTRTGLFDERLGAGAAGCSEDSELWYRILAEGGTCLYEPRAVVHHHHRADWADLEKQMHAYLRGHVAALAVQHARYRHAGNLRRIALQLPRHFVRTAFRTLRDGATDQRRLLTRQVLGWLSGLALVLRPGWRRAKGVPDPPGHRTALRPFLAANPFSNPVTGGLFYREKMRAIHRIAPERLPASDATPRVLEVGGGRSGLGTLLYPGARITTVDLDAAVLGQGPDAASSRFACGDACALPFPDGTFDLVTLFDVLEHIVDDSQAAREALRVTRPGGWVLVSTPVAEWRYPYHRFMRRWCPPEEQLMGEWGHVRRGYDPEALARLFGAKPRRAATFINPVTAFFHDVGFSRLGARTKRLLYALAAPPTLAAYLLHRPGTRGTETALAWRRSNVASLSDGSPLEEADAAPAPFPTSVDRIGPERETAPGYADVSRAGSEDLRREPDPRDL